MAKTKSSMHGPLRTPMAGNLANKKDGGTLRPKVAPNTTIPGSAPKSAAPIQSPLPPRNPGRQSAGGGQGDATGLQL